MAAASWVAFLLIASYRQVGLAQRPGSAKKAVRVLVVIPSCWAHRVRRDSLRRWFALAARGSASDSPQFAHRFLMSSTASAAALHESAVHNDIAFVGEADCNKEVSTDGLDDELLVSPEGSTSTVTYKVWHAFRWSLSASQFDFDFLVKAEDQCLLQMERLLKSLSLPQFMEPGQLVYFGAMATPSRSLKVPQESDAVSYFQTVFPSGHALAFAYGISRRLVELLANWQMPVKLRARDDLSLGMWLAPIAGVQYIHFPIEEFHTRLGFGRLPRRCSERSIAVYPVDEALWNAVLVAGGRLIC